MPAEAEGVLAVASIGRAPRRLDIGDTVRLGSEHSQKGLRMHRPSTHLDVVRLLDDAAAIGPVSLEIENQGLQVQERLRACRTSRKYTTTAAFRRYFLNSTDLNLTPGPYGHAADRHVGSSRAA